MAWYDATHGTMWSLTAATMYASLTMSDSASRCPSRVNSPRASSFRRYRDRRYAECMAAGSRVLSAFQARMSKAGGVLPISQLVTT